VSHSKDCVFCRIISGDIPAKHVYEDQDLIAIKDLHPRAPMHELFLPKAHIRSLEDLSSSNADIVSKLTLAAVNVAKREGVAKKGFRTVINCNEWAGQTVFHLHLHLLAGEKLKDDDMN